MSLTTRVEFTEVNCLGVALTVAVQRRSYTGRFNVMNEKQAYLHWQSAKLLGRPTCLFCSIPSLSLSKHVDGR